MHYNNERDLHTSRCLETGGEGMAGGELCKDVAEKMNNGIMPQYLTEIMSIPKYYTTYDTNNFSNFEMADSSFVINFIHYDEEELSYIIEKVKEIPSSEYS